MYGSLELSNILYSLRFSSYIIRSVKYILHPIPREEHVSGERNDERLRQEDILHSSLTCASCPDRRNMQCRFMRNLHIAVEHALIALFPDIKRQAEI